MQVIMKMKLRKPQKKLLNKLQENNKNADKELLSMLEDLLVEGMEMEVVEVVMEEEEVEDKEIMIMMISRKNANEKKRG
jgi:hypothetical protein